ncbi:MAG: hypothetical protein LBN01_00285 [Endomicrobium sp.]|jgi:hypothetical protein|nr:hypothetical protein [Endomicrobium sp.]
MKDRVVMHFKNCYGINELDYPFDFNETKSYAIYAPNGTMKTSFAKTLIDYSKGQTPDILEFPNTVPSLSITYDESSQPINPQNIFVIKSEINDFNTDKMSTLLVNKELRQKHLSITKQIDDKKNTLVKELQKISKIKNPNNLELVFIKDITSKTDINLFFTALEDQKSRVETSEKEFLNIEYNTLFNDKTETIFETKDFILELEKYMMILNKLISSSAFFKKGEFNHANADTVAKQLMDNGFFKAKHKVIINTRTGIKKPLKQQKI